VLLLQYSNLVMSKQQKQKQHMEKNGDRFDTRTKPQFRRPKEETRKLVLDDRFASVLTDSRFQTQQQSKDKYGRKSSKRNSAKEELGVFYTLDNEGKEDAKDAQQERLDANEKPDHDDADDFESNSEPTNLMLKKQDNNPASRIAYLTALSRGQIDPSSSSDNTDSEDSDDDSQDDLVDMDGAADADFDYNDKDDDSNIELTHEETKYLAVMNLDWTHVRAVDVFALLHSFAPPGAVQCVTVYPSDFGRAQMEKELTQGPKGLWKQQPTRENQVDIAAITKDNDNDQADACSDDQASSQDDNGTNTDEEDEDDDTTLLVNADVAESDFDPEKLRAYEASKLKYYFAIAEFTSSQFAEVAYQQVDGMEFEHSSAAVDLRAIPESELASVVQGRAARDQATSIPSNYMPPEFIVSALQQSTVQCTWEVGDAERQRTLTKYTSGEQWNAIAETEDLKAYLASDHSSDEGEEVDSDNEKAARMRKMLGLDSDDEGSNSRSDKEEKGFGSEDVSSSDSDNDDSDDGQAESKEVTFIPGQKKVALEDKIRSKLDDSDKVEELTPWQKYQEKRKQKRSEKRQETRAKRKEINQLRKGGRSSSKSKNGDEFFTETANKSQERTEFTSNTQSQGELELLVAGDGNDDAKDYDMRGLLRLDKNKEKKLKGSRKRKEELRATDVGDSSFQVDMKDTRFQAVLEGADDRFGIDRTDPNFKETPGMRAILAEQATRRKRRKNKMNDGGAKTMAVAENANADIEGSNMGSAVLSALVSSIKAKVVP
jgi:hypothetical protein